MRNYWLLLAEGQLSRERFGSMLRWIAALPLLTGFARLLASDYVEIRGRRREGGEIASK